MTKTFCDWCEKPALEMNPQFSNPGSGRLYKKQIVLRTIFEIKDGFLTGTGPQTRTQCADLCGSCMAHLLKGLAEKLTNTNP